MAVEEAVEAVSSRGSFYDAEMERWWSIPLLFLMVLVIDVLVEIVNESVTHLMERRNMTSLMRAWSQLKFEIMALGVVSLLLVVFEEELLKICVNQVDLGHESTDDAAHNTTSSDEASHLHSDTESHGPNPHETDPEHARRRLFASTEAVECPDGKEQLWSASLIHKVHLLIFLIAVSHIVYSTVSVMLAMLAMRRWHSYEGDRELMPLPINQLRHEGEPRLTFFLRQTLRQFTDHIDMSTYVALRYQFIEIMRVPNSFNFAKFVSDFLTDEFAMMFKLDVFMWVLAILWAIPKANYAVTLWIPLALLVVSIFAGGKLQSIVARLAHRVYAEHYQAVKASATEQIQEDEASQPGSENRSGDGNGNSSPTASTPTRRNSFNPTKVKMARKSARPKRILRAIRGHSQKIANIDAIEYTNLFWFKRPRLLLRIFQYAYFQNSLALAMVVFSYWQEEKSLFHHTHGARIMLSVFSLLLLLHTSMYMMPIYALTAASVNFGGAQKLIAEDTQRLANNMDQRYHDRLDLGVLDEATPSVPPKPRSRRAGSVRFPPPDPAPGSVVDDMQVANEGGGGYVPPTNPEA